MFNVYKAWCGGLSKEFKTGPDQVWDADLNNKNKIEKENALWHLPWEKSNTVIIFRNSVIPTAPPGSGAKPKELIMNKQCQRVHDYMVKHGSISPIEAFLYLGVTKLATRISEMRRRDGIDVVKVPFVGMNRFGEKVRYMKYYLPDLSSEKKEA